MTRAWYGVSSTGNQSGVALERQAEANASQYPLAVAPLTQDRYVDDIASGADSLEARECQTEQTRKCLEAGGFSIKFVAKSGDPPPKEASADGSTVGCLGLAWDTQRDELSPQLDSMNMQKRIHGQKAAPDRDVTTKEGIGTALKDGPITQVQVLSRVVKAFDPGGWVCLSCILEEKKNGKMTLCAQVPTELLLQKATALQMHSSLLQNGRRIIEQKELKILDDNWPQLELLSPEGHTLDALAPQPFNSQRPVRKKKIILAKQSCRSCWSKLSQYTVLSGQGYGTGHNLTVCLGNKHHKIVEMDGLEIMEIRNRVEKKQDAEVNKDDIEILVTHLIWILGEEGG
jgi:hypothetical protein